MLTDANAVSHTDPWHQIIRMHKQIEQKNGHVEQLKQVNA